MKIAFIMLCHTEPQHINRLLKKISEFSEADIYIHLDMNSPAIKEKIERGNNVTILSEEHSFHIVWGGINIVKATLELIRTAQNSGKTYDYIWLISGQDYPIVGVNEIERRLSEHPGMNYIDMVIPGDEKYDWYKKLYEVSYPTWINTDTIPVRIFKRLYKIITGGYNHTFKCFIRKKPFIFDLAFGSQWWTLTSEVAYDILQYSDNHPEILHYYNNTIIPDESFFQTLYFHGKYQNERKRSLTFISFGNNSRHPLTLTTKDLVKIEEARKEYCFARKFYDSSKDVIRMIEQLYH